MHRNSGVSLQNLKGRGRKTVLSRVTKIVLDRAVLKRRQSTKKMSKKLMEKWLEVWALRNSERHGVDEEERLRLKLARVRRELAEVYAMKDMVCPTERSIFYGSVEEHLAQNPDLDAALDWIRNFREALDMSKIQARRAGLSGNRSILEFFPLGRQPTGSAVNTRGLRGAT